MRNPFLRVDCSGKLYQISLLADRGHLWPERARWAFNGSCAAGRPQATALAQVDLLVEVANAGNQVCGAGSRIGYGISKRALDITSALLALVMLTPLLLALMLLVHLDSRGPAIFRQSRIGYRGHHFTLYKLRTMYHGAGDTPHRAAIARYMRGASLATTPTGRAPFKLEHDPRITRAGRWLRRLSLDELPQLVNVLRGDMSLVGPRPALDYEVEHYAPYHWQRFQVRPGITGMWQVYGRSQVPFAEMIAMDLTYIRNRSFWLDLKLLWLTIGVVLAQRGAV
jgi:lipopolysaccharide/colanic/teichoic acid biosynthesis glycosyltransferase